MDRRAIIRVLLSLTMCLQMENVWAVDRCKKEEHISGVSTMYDFSKPVEDLPVPKGYKAWAINHYGRHGARYLDGQAYYNRVFNAFEEAYDQGNLSPEGLELRNKFLFIKPFVDGKAGELTEKGREQQRYLAGRMQKAYPSVFQDNPTISAVSSFTPRCRESMEEFCSMLEGRYIEFLSDSANIRFTNPFEPLAACLDSCDRANRSGKAVWNRPYDRYLESIIDTTAFIDKLFLEGCHCSGIKAITLKARVFNLIQNLPCLDFEAPSFAGLYTKEEAMALWERDNIICFLQVGKGFYGSERQYLVATDLLENLIESSDSAAVSLKPFVHLRFGHDLVISSLLSLMDAEHFEQKASNFSEIKDVYQNWRIPMAANIHLVIYKNPHKKELLVRLYLNEEAVRLPVKEVGDRLYRWSEFKSHYHDVIERARELKKKPACYCNFY